MAVQLFLNREGYLLCMQFVLRQRYLSYHVFYLLFLLLEGRAIQEMGMHERTVPDESMSGHRDSMLFLASGQMEANHA